MAGSILFLGLAALLTASPFVEAMYQLSPNHQFSQDDLNSCNRYAGPILVQAHLKDKADFSAAHEIFQQVNATCTQNLQSRIQPCNQCTLTTCKAKITNECRQYRPASFWSQISSHLGGHLVQGLIGINSVVEGAVAGTLINIGGFIKDVGSFLTGDVSGQSFTNFGDFYAPGVTASLQHQFGLGDWFSKDFLGFWQTGAGAISSVANGIGSIFGANVATSWQSNVGGGIGDAAINILGSLGHAAGNIIGGTVGGAGHVIDGVGQGLEHLTTGLFGGGHGDAHVTVGGNHHGGHAGAGINVGIEAGHGGGLVGGLLGGAGHLVGGALDGAGHVVNGVGDAAGDILGGIAGHGGAGLNVGVGGHHGGYEGGHGGFEGGHGGGLIGGLLGGAGHLVGGALNSAGHVVNGVGNAAGDILGGIGGSLHGGLHGGYEGGHNGAGLDVGVGGINIGGHLGGHHGGYDGGHIGAGLDVGVGGDGGHGGGLLGGVVHGAGHLVGGAVNGAGSVVGGAINGAGSIVEGAGHAIGSLFSLKRSMEKRHFASFDSHETDPKEPTCSELATADMAAENCVFYQKECQACRYDFGTVCPGYKDTLVGYKTLANLYYRWKNVNFEIKQISGGQAIIDIFGNRYSLNLPSDLDLSNHQAVGATCALQAYALSTSIELGASGNVQISTGGSETGQGSTGGDGSHVSTGGSHVSTGGSHVSTGGSHVSTGGESSPGDHSSSSYSYSYSYNMPVVEPKN